MIQYLGIEVGEIRVWVVMVASVSWTYEETFDSYTFDNSSIKLYEVLES